MARKVERVPVPKSFLDKIDKHREELSRFSHRPVSRRKMFEELSKELPDNTFTWQEIMFWKQSKKPKPPVQD